MYTFSTYIYVWINGENILAFYASMKTFKEEESVTFWN